MIFLEPRIIIISMHVLWRSSIKQRWQYGDDDEEEDHDYDDDDD